MSDMQVHENKRFIGRTTAGFAFPSYRLYPTRRLRPSDGSVRRRMDRARRHSKTRAGSSHPRGSDEPLEFTSMGPQS
ncbi:hypothetical protein L1S32_06515 [Methanogenium sp. S4BF]|uniref:hypothetical protein n=1 Tax=Methanogenium sp. S4BF TaxID=1789226 RepID=UPI00241804D9|nr:hypothetical protein [Methanogenium sp. S4BF]WFN33510.1 hypothetical protein L1S32_06515 [Methanogenium sp. S4BF]